MNLEMDNKFLNKLNLINKDYLSGKYTLLNEANSWDDKCIVLDEFGIKHNILFKSLVKGNDLTIKSAIDKTKYFIEILKSKDLLNGYNIIGKYTSSSKKIEVEDKYGISKIKPNSLMNGSIPTIRSAVNKTLYFCNMAVEKHENIYDYSEVVWESATKKVKIICNVDDHGEFLQTPNNHLNGRGCDKCRMSNRKTKVLGWSLTMWIDNAKKSKNFDSFKFYVLKCWNEKEEFYKIGRTFTSIAERYKNRFKYKYKIVTEDVMTAKDCYEKEIRMRAENKNNKYIPLVKFNGYTECYKKLNTYE